jgi:hypothetical protein
VLNIQDFHRYAERRAAIEQRATEERRRKSLQDARQRLEELKRELERLEREYKSPPEIRPRLIENG